MRDKCKSNHLQVVLIHQTLNIDIKICTALQGMEMSDFSEQLKLSRNCAVIRKQLDQT